MAKVLETIWGGIKGGGKYFYENTFKKYPEAYYGILASGVICMVAGMGIGGCYDSSVRKQRDNYKREVQGLTLQNTSLKERNNELGKRVEFQEEIIGKYKKITENSVKAATNIAQMASRYAIDMIDLDQEMKKQSGKK